MKRFPHNILYVFAGIVLLSASCRSVKFVDDGEYLLDKVEIDSDNPDYALSALRRYIRQQPNFKLFGLVKWQLYVYNWSGRNEKNWFNKQLRRIGEAPVIMDSALVRRSASELNRFLFNKGYVHVEVNTVIDTAQHKKAAVTYRIVSHEPYRIGTYQMTLDDPNIDSIARLSPPHRSAAAAAFRSAPEGYSPLVKEGDLFDRENLDKERQRITALLRRRGYYAFNRDYLIYQADTASRENIVDLEMLLLPFRKVHLNGTVSETPHYPYYINDVALLTDYDAMLDSTDRYTPTDTVISGDISIRYGKNGHSIRPSVLSKAVYLTPGRLYNERSMEQTYSTFYSLRALKSMNIRFTEFEENDSMKLNALIFTMPAETQSLSVDMDGTNSAGDFGFASSLSYRHNNLFKGSEGFTARLRGAYESLSGNKGNGLDSYWELGGEASVLFPSFLFPFLSERFRRSLRASTELQANYNSQSRPEYARSILSAGWNYIWQERNNTLARHTFKLLDVDYVFLSRIESSFRDSLPKSMQLYNYSDQFIMSSGYSYSFNNFTQQGGYRNTHSLRVSFETAGNLLHALSALTHARKNASGLYELSGINYSQFVKGDIDFGKGIVLDNRNSLAFHAGAGIAFPYGNAAMMPFERRYFAGGANSVRGWSVRELGPGSMSVRQLPHNTRFALQTGDVRIDLSMEYRTKLFWKFELAAYADAGNIWTIRSYPDQPDGNFDFARFYKELAVSYGLGLRVDLDFFLIRFDTGLKVFNPQERGERRWAVTRPNLSDNFALHFAVGYPF
ncbi:Outer membrane protein/protective antigen OMA87 [Bacteroidales bacterium Barb6XT]|nr:Outer membrane protein/protective antigen OMA87 [Bacteroidales bacterium Barb6XT]